MTKFEIHVVGGNAEGQVVRCPECGQVLYILNGLEGKMKTTAQCRRCHAFVSIRCESIPPAEVEK